MKILHVFGDDYAAVGFELVRDSARTGFTERLWYDAVTDDYPRKFFLDSCFLESEFEGVDSYFLYAALEFGNVDPDFVEWLKTEVLDADSLKSANFYVVENDYSYDLGGNNCE